MHLQFSLKAFPHNIVIYMRFFSFLTRCGMPKSKFRDRFVWSCELATLFVLSATVGYLSADVRMSKKHESPSDTWVYWVENIWQLFWLVVHGFLCAVLWVVSMTLRLLSPIYLCWFLPACCYYSIGIHVIKSLDDVGPNKHVIIWITLLRIIWV